MLSFSIFSQKSVPIEQFLADFYVFSPLLMFSWKSYITFFTFLPKSRGVAALNFLCKRGFFYVRQNRVWKFLVRVPEKVGQTLDWAQYDLPRIKHWTWQISGIYLRYCQPKDWSISYSLIWNCGIFQLLNMGFFKY